MTLRPSLLTKVLLVAFGNLLVLGAVFLSVIRMQLRLDPGSFLVSPVRDHVLAATRLLALQLGETEPAGWDALVARHETANQVGLRVIDEGARVLAGSREPLPAEIVTRFLARWERPGRGGRGGPRDHHDDHGDLVFLGIAGNPARHWVAVAARVPPPGVRERRGSTWILVSSSGHDALFHADATPWIAAGVLVILISVAFWLPFVRGLTRSISRMTAATSQIAEGRFETQLPVGRRDELGVLGASIAKMAGQLDRLVNGQKRFLRDAAHELRSPIARIQVALGLLERSAAEGQKAVIEDLNEDIQQMSALVDDVLSYSRVDQRAVEPKMQNVRIASLARRMLERDFGNSENITASIPETLAVRADPGLLLRALSNVVRNAVRYAGDAGPVGISARSEGPGVVIAVTDCGPGVPEKDLDAIFEPFYRLQSARERTTGGVGLGLAITRSCIEACAGVVRCRNREPHGLEVEFRLPAATSADGEPSPPPSPDVA